MMRRRRFRWVAVGVILLAGLYLAFDVVAVQYLESRGANELARALAAEEAKVDLGSIPFLPGFIGGRIRHAEVDVRGASGGRGLRVQTLKARMSDLRFSWRRLLALSGSIFSTRTTVKAMDPFFLIEIGEADLEEFLKRHAALVGDVRIAASGIEVRFLNKRLDPGAEPTQDDLTEPARLLPRINSGRIVLTVVGLSQIPEPLRPAALGFERLIDLPQLPKGLRTDVRLGDGVFVVEATGKEVELEVGEGES